MKAALRELVAVSERTGRFFCLNYDFDFLAMGQDSPYCMSPFYLSEVCPEDNQVTVAIAHNGMLAVFVTEDRHLTLPLPKYGQDALRQFGQPAATHPRLLA